MYSYLSNDRTDYNTLIPVLNKHEAAFGSYPKEVRADSGYCSEKNLIFLKKEGITSYIRLQTHEKRKTKAYREDIGKYYNMMYMIESDTHYYRCHDGRRPDHIRTESSEQDGYTRKQEVYACADCGGCEHKAKCLYRYEEERDVEKNKLMKVNEEWNDLQAQSHENIESDRGILNRQIRSIQTEGHFGDIKENENFRRFHYRGTEKVTKEFPLYAFGRNVNKYARFTQGKLKKYEMQEEETAA